METVLIIVIILVLFYYHIDNVIYGHDKSKTLKLKIFYANTVAMNKKLRKKNTIKQ